MPGVNIKEGGARISTGELVGSSGSQQGGVQASADRQTCTAVGRVLCRGGPGPSTPGSLPGALTAN